MANEGFLDTNVLLYALAPDPTVPFDPRIEASEDLLTAGGRVSVQVLSEFSDVAFRKFKKSWRDIEEMLEGVAELCGPPIPITAVLHREARALSERYRFRIYDSLIVAAALEAGCRVLYTEDLQHGQVIDGLRIENPFKQLS